MTETLLALGFTPITESFWALRDQTGRRLSWIDGSVQLTDEDTTRWVSCR